MTSEALELDKILRKKFQENEKQLVEVLSEEEVSELSRMLEKILSADI